MSITKFLDYLLSKEGARAKALEFVQVVSSDTNCKLKPMLSLQGYDLLDSLIREARRPSFGLPSLSEYLSVSEKREFLKVFLLCLISTGHPFQPNSVDGWEPFRDLIREMQREGFIMDPSAEDDGYACAEEEREKVSEYLIEPPGEQFLWGALRTMQ